MSRMRSKWIWAAVAVAALSTVALLGIQSSCDGSRTTDDPRPGVSDADGVEAPQLGGTGEQSPPKRGAASTAIGGSPESESPVGVYIRSHMPEGWTESRRFAVNPQKAQKIVASAPGGIDRVVAWCCDSDQAASGDIGSFACAVMSAWLAGNTAPTPERRSELTSAILGALDTDSQLAPYQILAALEFLWRLNYDELAFSASRWTVLLLDVADEMLRSGDLRAYVALARLGVSPGVVAHGVLRVLPQRSCENLGESAHLLQHPDLLGVLRRHGGVANEDLVGHLEACAGVPGMAHLAVVLRVARHDQWDALYRRLKELGANPETSALEYIACVKEAMMYRPDVVPRVLPGLLRLRPDLRISEAAPLLSPSLGWVRNVRQLLELVEFRQSPLGRRGQRLDAVGVERTCTLIARLDGRAQHVRPV